MWELVYFIAWLLVKYPVEFLLGEKKRDGDFTVGETFTHTTQSARHNGRILYLTLTLSIGQHNHSNTPAIRPLFSKYTYFIPSSASSSPHRQCTIHLVELIFHRTILFSFNISLKATKLTRFFNRAEKIADRFRYWAKD